MIHIAIFSMGLFFSASGPPSGSSLEAARCRACAPRRYTASQPSYYRPVPPRAQAPAQAQTAPPTPESMVDQWFIRLNALDEWFISVDGKEETDAVVNRFADLYNADAYHEVQPSENQLGPVVFHGRDGIRHWATDFAKKYVHLAYRIDYMTRSEKPTQLLYTVKPPWGGSAAAVEFSAVWTDRQSRKRFMMPGSAFFLFDEAGKILRVRWYMLKDLLVEIQP